MMRSFWIAIIWTLVILVLCWTPRGSLPIREGAPSFLRLIQADKMVHFGIFAVFAVLWRRASGRAATVLIGVIGVIFAIVTELGQEIPIVNRDADFWDGLADSLGVVSGLVFFGMINGRAAEPINVPLAPERPGSV
jgi:hypothetical protein